MKNVKDRTTKDIILDLNRCASGKCGCIYMILPPEKCCYKLLMAEAAEALTRLDRTRSRKKTPEIYDQEISLF